MGLLCLGDIHLSHCIWETLPDIRDDAFVGFRSFIDLAVASKTPVILCGDVFDVPNPAPDILAMFRKEMDRCQAAGIRVFYFQGNHDKRLTPWGSSVHDHPIYVGDGKPFEVDGIKCIALDYAGREKIQANIAAANAEHPQVLFLHQAVRQAIGFENAWNCDLDWVTAPVTVMGDIHKPLDLRYGESGLAYYTNATCARSVSEFGRKSCVLLKPDLSIERPVLQHRSFMITETDAEVLPRLVQWAADCAKAPTSQLQPVLFLRHPQGRVEEVTAAKQALKDVRIVLRPYSLTIPDKIEDETGISLQEMLAKRLPPNGPAYKLVLDLLESNADPLEIIRSHKEVFLNAEVTASP